MGKMPEFKDKEQPKWSNGWLEGFKGWFKIKKFKQHGEAADADILESTEEMEALRTLYGEYHSNDIYNADETGLY